MSSRNAMRNTTVGAIDNDVLAYTVGRDLELDMALAQADCIGTAAHVTMLAQLPVHPRLFSARDHKRVIRLLIEILQQISRGQFIITVDDQDVHMAVERMITDQLGDIGKRIHTARSRNDQIAVDLRLFSKERILETMKKALMLAVGLLTLAKKHQYVPMVGRTHMQPAMPSTVGLWASAHAESLLDDISLLSSAYELNDQCPLGSAASYGVPLPIDRELTAALLGFSRPVHNVLYANNARGKLESIILSAMSQIMLSLSRLAQDLILFSMPEFGYFTLPKEYCTGSSIMPQKSNPDVLELVRAKAASLLSSHLAVSEIVRALPSGYNRDLQETKGYFIDGITTTTSSLSILTKLLSGVAVCEKSLINAFSPEVFATDRALELVMQGVAFRDAYRHIKEHIDELQKCDPRTAVLSKTHYGATAGLDWRFIDSRIEAIKEFVDEEYNNYYQAISSLLGIAYPLRLTNRKK